MSIRPPCAVPNLRLGLHQSARLQQRLLQSPQMIQAMQILQLPLLDLEARIEQELTENPCLEREEAKESENATDEGFADFEGDEVVEIRLYPIELGWKAPRSQRGTPRIAPEALGRKIIEHLAELSAPLGTSIRYEDGIGVWRR